MTEWTTESEWFSPIITEEPDAVPSLDYGPPHPIPYSDIKIQYDINNGNEIFWDFKSSTIDIDYVNLYFIGRSRQDEDQLEEIETGIPLTRSSSTDSTKRSFSLLKHGGYVLAAADTDQNFHWSNIASVPSNWTRRDFEVANKVVSRENRFYQHGGSGISFKTLHKRYSQERCESCTDPVSGEITNPECQECFGTGKIDSFYTPYETLGYISNRTQQLDKEKADTVEEVLTIRTCNLPLVTYYDLVILEDLGRRGRIINIEAGAQIKGHPIINNIMVEVLKLDHVIYKKGLEI